MSVPPLVSCIVPAYNAERYLRETLDSLLEQSGVSFEIIVVDDGSKDATASIADSYGTAIQLVRQQNAGHAAARNRGIAEARGTLITFMDADDLSPTDRFALQVQPFVKDPDLDLCAGFVQNFEGDMLFTGSPLPGYNSDMMVRSSVLARVGPFSASEQHAARLDWMLRARRAGVKELLLPDVLVYRRLHERNMSRTETSQSLREHLRVLHASIRQKT